MFESGLQRIYNDVGPFGVLLLVVYILFILAQLVRGLYLLIKIKQND